jgi:hypothetical protein
MRSVAYIGHLAVLVAAVAASTSNTRVFEELYSAPQGWEVDSEPSPHAVMNFRIALQAVSEATHRLLY